ncbi:MAG: hypothetical protein M9962_15665 [Oligoflexia bacterium]|nr:hypothetical protein [Oligoflexia bacterium]
MNKIWMLFIGLLLVSGIAISASDEKEKPVVSVAKKQEKPKSVTPVALTLEAIQELEDRKKELDAREQRVAEKENELKLQEKIIQEKLKKIEELQSAISNKLDGFKTEHEGKITKLVSVVETMKPQAAAEYLENLDPELAVEILAKIQIAKAAKILNLVDKKKGAKLSELYTGYSSGIKKDAEPVQENGQQKGGEDVKKM